MLTSLDSVDADGPEKLCGKGLFEQNKAERKAIGPPLQFQNPVADFLSFVFFSTGLFFFKRRADSVSGQAEGGGGEARIEPHVWVRAFACAWRDVVERSHGCRAERKGRKPRR